MLPLPLLCLQTSTFLPTLPCLPSLSHSFSFLSPLPTHIPPPSSSLSMISLPCHHSISPRAMPTIFRSILPLKMLWLPLTCQTGREESRLIGHSCISAFHFFFHFVPSVPPWDLQLPSLMSGFQGASTQESDVDPPPNKLMCMHDTPHNLVSVSHVHSYITTHNVVYFSLSIYCLSHPIESTATIPHV